MKKPENITYIEFMRIRLEAIAPLIRVMEKELGKEKVKELLHLQLEKNLTQAKKSALSKPGFNEEVEKLKIYEKEQSLRFELESHTESQLVLKVHKCSYVDLVNEMGLKEYGALLICGDDFAGALKDGMELRRSQTCMEGGEYCDFFFTPRLE